jgi:tRNA pseudouridine32 synthase / 23S rRNA pseudouridine746 synthase
MNDTLIKSTDFFLRFDENTEGVVLPIKFTFPFSYEPHLLSKLAAKELQAHIERQNDWKHDFGLAENEAGLGKMFGVLVVQNKAKELGYLAAFSGKLAGSNHHPRFVPPVFDILTEDSFYRQGEEVNNAINRRVEALENDIQFLELKALLKTQNVEAAAQIEALKEKLKIEKNNRDTRRNEAKMTLSPTNFDIFEAKLNRESADLYYQLKDLKRTWQRSFAETQTQLEVYFQEINALKNERKARSSNIQMQLFEQYTFLNIEGETKSLSDIFPISDDVLPPAGAGECAAPKLLQYAFLHKLKPIALAEFWWGQSPVSEIRKHGNFYPACKSKCEPILSHMLKGIPLDDNPTDTNPALGKDFETVFEDAYLLVVNKPAEFFAVPGKKIHDSIYTRIKEKYPEATGPLVVHRLDVSTSGLMLIAKTKAVHQHLQSQFIKRKIKKRYVALIDGVVDGEEGFIDLPLRVDLDDRPRQLVCHTHGKPAQTRWQVVERMGNRTKVHFFPITGRTHQLRVHAAHPQGLNMPIVGDELYGTRADRLYLHAAWLSFVHPVSEVVLEVEVGVDF